MNFKFEIDKHWSYRSWLDRFCVRHVCKMIAKSQAKTYQFGGYTGAKKLAYELINAEKYQLMHWILREAGYNCCPADVMERCGVDYIDKKDVVGRKKRVVLIGSTQYQQKFAEHKLELEKQGFEVRIPAFDSHPDLDELGVCKFNREAIRWADRVDIIWDQRSQGTIFDFGMTFMIEKPIEIIYLEKKTFKGVMEKYEAEVGALK